MSVKTLKNVSLKYKNVNFSKRIFIKKKIRLAYVKKYQRFNIWNQDRYFRLKGFQFLNKRKRVRNKNFYFFKVLLNSNKEFFIPKYKNAFYKKHNTYINKIIVRPVDKNLFASVFSNILIKNKKNNSDNFFFNHKNNFLEKKELSVSGTTTGLPFKISVISSYFLKLNELWRTRFHLFFWNFINKYSFFFPKLSYRKLLLYLFIGSLNYQKNYVSYFNKLNKYRFNWLKKKNLKKFLHSFKKNSFFFKFFFLNYSLVSYNNLFDNNLLKLNFNYNKILKKKINTLHFLDIDFKPNNMLSYFRFKILKGNDINLNLKLFNSLLFSLPLNNDLFNKNIKNKKRILFLQFYKNKWFLNKLNRFKGSKNWWSLCNKLKSQKLLNNNFAITLLKLKKYKKLNLINNDKNYLLNLLNLKVSQQQKKYKLNKLFNKYKNYFTPLKDNFVNSLNNFWFIWQIVWFWTKKITLFYENHEKYKHDKNIVKYKDFNFINSLDMYKLKSNRLYLQYYFNHYSIFQFYGLDILKFKYFKSNSWKQRFNLSFNLRSSSKHFNIWKKYFNNVLNFDKKFEILNLYTKLIFVDYFKFNYKNIIFQNYLKNYLNNINYSFLNLNVNYLVNKNKLKTLRYSYFNVFEFKNELINKNLLYNYTLKNNINVKNNYISLIFMYIYLFLYKNKILKINKYTNNNIKSFNIKFQTVLNKKFI